MKKKLINLQEKSVYLQHGNFTSCCDKSVHLQRLWQVSSPVSAAMKVGTVITIEAWWFHVPQSCSHEPFPPGVWSVRAPRCDIPPISANWGERRYKTNETQSEDVCHGRSPPHPEWHTFTFPLAAAYLRFRRTVKCYRDKTKDSAERSFIHLRPAVHWLDQLTAGWYFFQRNTNTDLFTQLTWGRDEQELYSNTSA